MVEKRVNIKMVMTVELEGPENLIAILGNGVAQLAELKAIQKNGQQKVKQWTDEELDKVGVEVDKKFQKK